MSATAELLLGLSYCLFMLLLIWVLSRNTPKQVNMLYGYRTARSMRTPETWKAANAYANKLMLRFTLYSFGFPLIGWLLWRDHNFLVTVIGHTLLIVLVIYFTEGYLKRNFDSKGRPKT